MKVTLIIILLLVTLSDLVYASGSWAQRTKKDNPAFENELMMFENHNDVSVADGGYCTRKEREFLNKHKADIL